MTGKDQPKLSASAARFTKFKKRKDVRKVTEQYADWALTPQGIEISLQLSLLGLMYTGGVFSRTAFDAEVRHLTLASGIPPQDMRIMAECQLELLRGMPIKLRPVNTGNT